MLSISKSYNIILVNDCFMSCRKDHRSNKTTTENVNNYSIKKNNDVVDRFLSVLWRREVDWKLTFK